MKLVANKKYLTATEAAIMLQPFMPNKSALSWLNHDRKTNPAIPFDRLDDQVYYQEEDLLTFIRYAIKSAPILRGTARRRPTARRMQPDRRKAVNRRQLPDRRPASGERRHAPTP